MRRLYQNNREGMALAMALFAIVVIGALIAGAFFASTQDFRVGTNSLVAQRAFSAAEFGLNKTMAEWDTKLNIGIKTGKDTTYERTFADGGAASVRITRLNQHTYWVVSEGRAGTGTSVETRRRTSAVLRLAYPAVKVGGALTLAGGGYVRGDAKVSGANTNPAGWDCIDYPGRDTTAIAYAPLTTVTVQKPQNVIGNPATYADPNAADDGTYIKYGDENWQTLVANADIRISGSVGPAPVGTATTCNTTGVNQITNWGEPLRAPGSIAGCYSYFPIIYATTDLKLETGRGQGILLVEGSLQINGNFQFTGLIIIRDKILRGNGTPTVFGAVMARNAAINETNDDGSAILGTANWQYSKCALESALQGSARLLPAKHRAWAELW
jgi:hypothetical protein